MKDSFGPLPTLVHPAAKDRSEPKLTESGLNDGICVPIFLALLALATNATDGQHLASIAFELIVQETGIGVAAGVALVGAAMVLMRWLGRPEMIPPAWRLLLIPALALACFSTAQALGGSGFIASFVGSLLFGGLVGRERKEAFLIAAEGIGGLAALLTWVLFGADVVNYVVGNMSWSVLVYAVLSLTLERMVPVWWCLRGTWVPTGETWFGPRGLANIVFTTLAIEADMPGAEVIAVVAACTILISVVGHGLTAKPFSRLVAQERTRTKGPR